MVVLDVVVEVPKRELWLLGYWQMVADVVVS